MNRQSLGTVPSVHIDRFRKPGPAPCPECETRFPLQILVAELLRKNQMLRLELQEARGRLAAADPSLFGQESY